MKMIIRYYKNQRGMTLILFALILVVLLMVAGLAVDISYMYRGKGELQAAADAAAIAGAARLDLTPTQVDARNMAWKAACMNKAAGSNVYLVTDGTDCKIQPGDLNNSNDPDGDIVVGQWDLKVATGKWEFDPAGRPINALKVVARRTKDAPVPNIKNGNNPIGLFLSRVSRIFWADWSSMNARAEAIAQNYVPLHPLPT
jgi:hypothetical protein